MAKRKPIPKTQTEISKEAVNNPGDISYTKRGFDRALNTKVTTDDPKPFTVGIQDIDESILYYFQNIIKPTVSKNGQNLEVPIYYGSPERWSAIQKDGFMRGRDGQLLIPAVVFKRTNITRQKITNKLLSLDNKVQNFYAFKPKFTKENAYDNFSILNGLNNRIPTGKLHLSVVPDFVTINYSCVIFTDFVEHMNKITEAINYASDSYWGDPARFKFKSTIDSFSPTVELNTGGQRSVKTTFDIKLQGYLIPDVAIKDLSYDRIVYSPSKIVFEFESVVGGADGSNVEFDSFDALKAKDPSINQSPSEVTQVTENPDAPGGGDLGI